MSSLEERSQNFLLGLFPISRKSASSLPPPSPWYVFVKMLFYQV